MCCPQQPHISLMYRVEMTDLKKKTEQKISEAQAEYFPFRNV